ncbi:hypothetical protein D1007_45038 [Hordeum vulgare]|nr:hypothetical protein D1007_45038 [Hordeum vulgare]
MDDDAPTLDAATGLACLAFAGPVSAKGGCKGSMTTRKNKVLTCEERAVQSAKRKHRWHEQEARKEAAHRRHHRSGGRSREEPPSHRCRHGQTLLMLGLNPGRHGIIAAVVSAASIGSSLSMSPHMSTTLQGQGFERKHPQTSRLSNSAGSSSPEVSVVAPAMPVPAAIDLNAMPLFSGGARKRPRQLPADALGNAHNMFDRMSATEDKANRVFMESLVYEDGGGGIPFDPDETQSEDDRTPFMAGHDGIGYPFCEDMADPLMVDQLGLDNSFPLNHEFQKDYGLDEEDDEVDIDGEPLFDELPAQGNAKKKWKSKQTKAYT